MSRVVVIGSFREQVGVQKIEIYVVQVLKFGRKPAQQWPSI